MKLQVARPFWDGLRANRWCRYQWTVQQRGRDVVIKRSEIKFVGFLCLLPFILLVLVEAHGGAVFFT